MHAPKCGALETFFDAWNHLPNTNVEWMSHPIAQLQG